MIFRIYLFHILFFPTSVIAASNYLAIISFDGLSPTGIQASHTPNIDHLISLGAYSRTARTILPPKTLPAHASMLSGLNSKKHRFFNNSPLSGKKIGYPTIIDLAKSFNISTAASLGKTKVFRVSSMFGKKAFDDLYKPSILNFHKLLLFLNPIKSLAQRYLKSPANRVASKATKMIKDFKPRLLFIHFAEPDRAGHIASWESSYQYSEIRKADKALGKIIKAYKQSGIFHSTTFIVTADHGGVGKGHGNKLDGTPSDPDNDDYLDYEPQSYKIPWIISGAKAPRSLPAEIYIYDTAATAADILGLPIPNFWDGNSLL